MIRRVVVLIVVLLITFGAAGPLSAQDDRRAGLFTKAAQLPLVSQSVVVRIHGGEAVVELTQIFANPGEEIAQAAIDYGAKRNILRSKSTCCHSRSSISRTRPPVSSSNRIAATE